MLHFCLIVFPLGRRNSFRILIAVNFTNQANVNIRISNFAQLNFANPFEKEQFYYPFIHNEN